MGLFLELLWFFKKEKWSYLVGTLALILIAIMNLYPPYIVRKVVDGITGATLAKEDLFLWLITLLGIGMVAYFLRFTWRMLIFGAAARLSRLLRNQLFEHFSKMSPGFYQRHRTGDLMAHATNDIQAIEITAGMGVLTLVDSVVTGGIVIFTMAYFISWKLTLITLLPMPFMGWLSSYYGNLLHDRFFIAQDAFGDLNDKVQENISGIRVVKAFGREKEEIASFTKLSSDVVKKNEAVAKVDALFDPTIMLLVGVSYFLAVAFGAWEIVNLELTLGELTQFTLYLGQFIWPMLAFGWLFNIMERGRASYDRVRTLLKEKSDVVDKISIHSEKRIAYSAPKPSGDIVFRVDEFRYPGQESPQFHDLHFTLKKGQTLGVVGKTGSGKTSLFRILLREFDGIKGDIRIGKDSIYDIPLDTLRSVIGYVPQEHFLFSTSIAENICLGKPNASEEEMIKVARIASIHEDIQGFEEKYETLVGDRGVTLSGGQKQRISIARALILNPEILLLDDSLSAVDANTEKKILERLKNNRENKTTIISSHRLSSVEHADLIIVLQDGRIAEMGTHSQLLSAKGWYAETYKAQQLENLIRAGGGAV